MLTTQGTDSIINWCQDIGYVTVHKLSGSRHYTFTTHIFQYSKATILFLKEHATSEMRISIRRSYLIVAHRVFTDRRIPTIIKQNPLTTARSQYSARPNRIHRLLIRLRRRGPHILQIALPTWPVHPRQEWFSLPFLSWEIRAPW